MSELDTLLEAALNLSDLAANLSTEAWSSEIEVSYKSDGSSLTSADLSIEARWREEIRRQFPSHGVLGEEFGVDASGSSFTWVLDPIDGTRQFGAGLLNYASLISLCRDGIPVLGIIELPIADGRYIAVEGQGTQFAGRNVKCSGQDTLSRSVISLANPESFRGTSAIGYEKLRSAGRVRVFDGSSLVYGALSRGLIDVCLNGDDLDAYDICALCPIVKEAGGTITDWAGQPLTIASSGAIVASASQDLHKAVLEKLSLPI